METRVKDVVRPKTPTGEMRKIGAHMNPDLIDEKEPAWMTLNLVNFSLDSVTLEIPFSVFLLLSHFSRVQLCLTP